MKNPITAIAEYISERNYNKKRSAIEQAKGELTLSIEDIIYDIYDETVKEYLDMFGTTDIKKSLTDSLLICLKAKIRTKVKNII